MNDMYECPSCRAVFVEEYAEAADENIGQWLITTVHCPECWRAVGGTKTKVDQRWSP